MRFNIHTRATLACSLGVLALSALASNFLLRAFFSLLSSPAETGLEKGIISPTALAISSGLIGLAMAVVLFRPILGWIRERGLPGWIPAPSPFEGKHIRVSLVVSETGALWKETYSQWVPAHHLHTMMKGPIGKSLTLANQQGERLTILRCLAAEDEGGGDIFVVKMKRARKVIYNFEMPSGSRGTFESPADQKFATCYYPLAFVGCDGTDSGGWLKFGGEKRLMRLVYLD
ncbi:MAG: hypothetical protein SGJ27_21100 [Candidatus Melainabacteria bacterium]|nr:hypothetical protein [Candidatus Melainabacteria bacterium]